MNNVDITNDDAMTNGGETNGDEIGYDFLTEETVF